jgi:hypothetical protein
MTLLSVARADFGLEDFDLLKQTENQSKRWRTRLKAILKVFDPAQGEKGFLAEVPRLISWRDESFFLIADEGLLGNAGDLRHDLKLIASIGIWLVEGEFVIHGRICFAD